MSIFDVVAGAEAGNDSSGSTQYLNYLENGQDDSRNAYYFVEVEEVKWLELERMWVVEHKVIASNNPAVPPNAQRSMSFSMGTETWKIQAFGKNVKNFILAANNMDPDDAMDLVAMREALEKAYPSLEEPKRWTKLTELAKDEKLQPLKGKQYYVECYRTKRKKETREAKAKEREAAGEAMTQDDTWGKFTKYNFKPVKFDNWKDLIFTQ